MKTLFNKTSLALGFSLLGAISSMSAIAMASDVKHQVHEIEVIAKDSDDVKVFVSVDGDVTDLNFPKSTLEDKAQLENALADVPEEIREKLLKTLSAIHHDGDVMKIEMHGDSTDHSSWVSDNEQVFVIHAGDENTSDIAQKVITKFKHGDGDVSLNKVFKFKHGGKLGADGVIRLLNHGKFSADDLDKIQQALDKKR
ncbi:hypothetical protein AADZ91_17920 [Colwelliaceae bacterium 6441]